MSESAGNSETSPRAAETKPRRAVLFRCLAVLIGLAPLVLLETLLWAMGWGQADLRDDPFIGFHGIRPLFVLNEGHSRFEIPPERQSFFRPASFAAEKPANGYRVLCLGGSTVQGRPYATETAFGAWLQIGLQAADPNRSWEVVNCGGVSYASYRLAPILQEVLEYEPDLIILYTGHNEFLEDRTYQDIKDQSAVTVRLQSWASRLRTYCWLRQGYLDLRGGSAAADAGKKPVLKDEVDAMLDYRNGLAQYHRDEAWHRGVMAHYRTNLRRMIDLAHQANVPLLLVNPVSNLRDTPPFKSEHRAGLGEDDLRRWEQLREDARTYYATDLWQTIALLEKALAIDDQHAGLHYQLGQCCDAIGQTERAAEHFLQAKELDVCPLRMLEPMHEDLKRIAQNTGTPMVDARALIAGMCRGGVPDQSWMVDHVHPSIRGHQQIANAIADHLVRQDVIHPAEDWPGRRDAAYQAHWDSLEPIYFEIGRQRLEILRDWSRGLMTRERDPPEAATDE
jgi:lysophospholipase L1-like esterase